MPVHAGDPGLAHPIRGKREDLGRTSRDTGGVDEGSARATGGILLTGGESRRMGRDKASLVVAGRSLAERSAGVLAEVCAPCVEVGPGRSELWSVREVPPGAGPLAAVVAGWHALRLDGAHRGPVLVLAVDLPRVSAALLRLLAGAPPGASVLPEWRGRLQPLCARYEPAALERADELLARGARSMGSLLDRIDRRTLAEARWSEVAEADALADVDSPEDLERFA